MTKMNSAFAATTLALFMASCQAPASETSAVSTREEIASDRSSGIAGDFVVVDARRASHVASPFNPELDVPIGALVTFPQNDGAISGLGCENWVLKPTEYMPVPVSEDPVLSDLALGGRLEPSQTNESKEGVAYNVMCEEKYLTQVQQIDQRILIATWANSTLNLILEKPMTETQVKDLQAELKSMKFYDGALSGALDEATVEAIRGYMDYRLAGDERSPIPARPAMTEALLVELGVLEK